MLHLYLSCVYSGIMLQLYVKTKLVYNRTTLPPDGTCDLPGKSSATGNVKLAAFNGTGVQNMYIQSDLWTAKFRYDSSGTGECPAGCSASRRRNRHLMEF